MDNPCLVSTFKDELEFKVTWLEPQITLHFCFRIYGNVNTMGALHGWTQMVQDYAQNTVRIWTAESRVVDRLYAHFNYILCQQEP